MEGLFAQARKAGLDMDALGEQLAARKAELTAEYEANGVPKPTLTTMEQGVGVSERRASAPQSPQALRLCLADTRLLRDFVRLALVLSAGAPSSTRRRRTRKCPNLAHISTR